MNKYQETSKLRNNVIITDDNFDDEFESICDELGLNYGIDVNFIKELPQGFEKQINEIGEEEFCRISFKPNVSHISLGGNSPIIIEETAFKFANGYMIICTMVDSI